MKTIYVIVHEDCVKAEFKTENGREARLVYDEIQRIKREEEFYRVNGFVDRVPRRLSKPNPDLEIMVCGAFACGDKDGCVDEQLLTLQRASYQAVIHKTGTLKSKIDSPDW